jgi:Delta7-sterol 5-desaturase
MIDNLISGENAMKLWIATIVVAGLAAGIATGFFKARKIQPKGFKWKTFRDEILFALITVTISASVLIWISDWLKANEWITFKQGPAAWWVIALEYAAYWITFDTWFYWLHRWMHKEPAYSLIHELHHRSNAPNLMTTFSVHPFESIINGGWVAIFTTVVSVHPESMALIGITAPIMGLYVHSGYEFLPRWWHKSWATKWFITTTFHDQHHKYFNYNFGGYTPVWDYICGTVRKNYEDDFLKLKDRKREVEEPATVPAE